MKTFAFVLAAALAAVAVPCPVLAQGLLLTRVVGGPLRDPVVVGDLVYVPGGRSITAWNYADPAAPTYVGEADLPNGGIVTGLARWGDYLYASWYAGDDAGVTVYSIADPQHIRMLSQFRNYFTDPYKRLWAVATAGDWLYLFDQENGMFRANLEPNPIVPTGFVRTPLPGGGIDYDHAVVAGDWMFVSGSVSFTSSPLYVCAIWNVAVPGDPQGQPGDCGSGSHPTFFNTRLRLPLAATFGLENFTLTDLSDPANATRLGSTTDVTAMDGFLHGGYAYGLGWLGIDIVDIRDTSQPTLVKNSPLSMLGVAATTPTADGALVVTNDDRFVRLDVATDPLVPRVVSTVSPPGGAYAVDVVPVGERLAFVNSGYGLGIAEAGKLTPLARFDAGLFEHMAARRMSDFIVDGNYGFLAASSYGLIVVDVSDPLKPVERARVEMAGGDLGNGDLQFALSGRHLFAVRTMFTGSYLQIVDVSNPVSPVVRQTFGVGGSNRVQAHGDFLYIADGNGLVIADIRTPTEPAQVVYWQGCEGVAPDAHPVEDVALSADGTRAYVACADRMAILDLADPANPQVLGEYVSADGLQSGSAVEVRGDRAWYGDGLGVHEIDVADPAAPALVRVTNLGDVNPGRLRALPDGRLFAFTPLSGIHVFGEAAQDAIFADGFEP